MYDTFCIADCINCIYHFACLQVLRCCVDERVKEDGRDSDSHIEGEIKLGLFLLRIRYP
jgi:hypothetical protein